MKTMVQNLYLLKSYEQTNLTDFFWSKGKVQVGLNFFWSVYYMVGVMQSCYSLGDITPSLIINIQQYCYDI